jgi:NAD(P)-dependent dehydrogenase (short-subunit alcohol dehydrogenase family)
MRWSCSQDLKTFTMAVNVKTALVTGANKGIGFSTVKQLLNRGYHVYLGSRDINKGKIAIDQLNKSGFHEISLLELDVTDAGSVRKAVTVFSEKYNHLDVLVNNAAIGGKQPQQTSVIPMDALKETFETNFFGVILVTQNFLPLMHKSRSPRIVNVSSELGSLSFLSFSRDGYYANNLMAYSASKVALNSFTVLLAGELQHKDFKINCVSPGYTATDLTNFGGGRTADEAAQVIVKYATLGEEGPSGQFFGISGQIPW